MQYVRQQVHSPDDSEGIARVAALKPSQIIGHKAIYDSDPIRPLHDDLAIV
jgi:hypothetical protein